MKRASHRLGLALSLCSLAGGAAAQDGRVYSAASPTTPAVAAGSTFDDALRCMDELLARTDVPRENTITALEFYDPTGGFGAATTDMVIASAMRMSERSRFFKVVEPPSGLNGQGRLIDPRLTVRGSITAFDRGVTGSGKSGGVDLPGVQLGGRDQKQASVLTVSLRFQQRDGAIVPGSSSSVSIALQGRGRGFDLTGRIAGLGAFGEVAFDRSEGQHQALRTLIDLAMIQAVGNFAHVPYSRCLTRPQADPASREQAQKRYSKMKAPERLQVMADELRRRGFYLGETPSTLTGELREAIASFMLAEGRPSTGLPNFETYYALVGDRFGAVAAPMSKMPSAPVPKVSPSGSNMFFTQQAGYVTMPRSRLAFTVALAADGHMACFYSDAHNRVTRIYPNAQQPAERIPAGQVVVLPGPKDVYAIVAGADLAPGELKPGTAARESVSCFATPDPLVARLPADLNAPALSATPLAPKGPIELGRRMRQVFGKEVQGSIFTYNVTLDSGALGPGPTAAADANKASEKK